MTDQHHLGVDPSADAAEQETDTALATGMRALVWDGDDDFLRARIQQSRASGARVLLPRVAEPLAPMRSRTRRSWRQRALVAGGGLAAFLLLSLVIDRAPRTPRATRVAPSPVAAAGDTSAEERAESLAEFLAPWPRLAFAQTGVGLPASFPPVRVGDVRRIHPGRRSYLRSVATLYHELLPAGVSTESVDSVTLAGTPAWRLVRTRGSLVSDTLWLNRATLQPLRRVSVVGEWPAHHSIRTSHDYSSNVDHMRSDMIDTSRQAPAYYRPRAGLPGRVASHETTTPFATDRVAAVSESSLELLLRTLVLQPGWRGSVAIPRRPEMGAAAPSMVAINLRVEGADTVETVAGRFPTWRVLLETGATPEVWQVSQETGEVLQVDDRLSAPYYESRRVLLGEPDAKQKAPRVRRR